MGDLLVVIGMTQVFKRSLGAATALSAVLALGSTSAFAQEAAPLDSLESITAPVAAAPAAPPVIAPVTPTVTLPQTTSTPAIVLPEASAPVAAPATTPEAAAPERPAPVARSTSGNTAARAPSPAAPATPTGVAETPATGTMLPAPAAQPNPMMADPMLDAGPEAAMEPVVPAAEPATSAEPATDGNTALAGLAALLGLVALGGAGFMLMRRRKPVDDNEREIARTELMLTEPDVMEPVRTTHVPPVREPVPARPAPAPLDASGKRVSPFIYNPIYQGKRAEERPVFVMPAGPVPTGERRSELLTQMVASRPDAANPFTSPKWRMRRARTLLSRREKMLREQAVRPFDFREFGTHTPIKPYRPLAKPPVPHMA